MYICAINKNLGDVMSCSIYGATYISEHTAHVVETLSRGSYNDILMAYQIALRAPPSSSSIESRRPFEGCYPPLTTPIQEVSSK